MWTRIPPRALPAAESLPPSVILRTFALYAALIVTDCGSASSPRTSNAVVGSGVPAAPNGVTRALQEYFPAEPGLTKTPVVEAYTPIGLRFCARRVSRQTTSL